MKKITGIGIGIGFREWLHCSIVTYNFGQICILHEMSEIGTLLIYPCVLELMTKSHLINAKESNVTSRLNGSCGLRCRQGLTENTVRAKMHGGNKG